MTRFASERPAATGVAAGMLAPVTEADFGEEALIDLNLVAARAYDEFIEEIEAETGAVTGYRQTGTLAVARLLLGPRMNLQAPPNLSPATYPRLLSAGLNDWGGISPLTRDHINPEAPWPELAALRDATERAGYELRERLSVYPEFIERPGFLDEGVRRRALAHVGDDGLVKPELESWRSV